MTGLVEEEENKVAYPDIGIVTSERDAVVPQFNTIVPFFGGRTTETSMAIDDCSTSWVVVTGSVNVTLLRGPERICCVELLFVQLFTPGKR